MDCKLQSFTGGCLKSMNLKYPWNGSIRNINDVDKNKRYILKATGDCTVHNGRQYIPCEVSTRCK